LRRPRRVSAGKTETEWDAFVWVVGHTKTRRKKNITKKKGRPMKGGVGVYHKKKKKKKKTPWGKGGGAKLN